MPGVSPGQRGEALRQTDAQTDKLRESDVRRYPQNDTKDTCVERKEKEPVCARLLGLPEENEEGREGFPRPQPKACEQERGERALCIDFAVWAGGHVLSEMPGG